MPPKKEIKSAPAYNTSYCLIERWSGRLGNNIIQIINAIKYAKQMQIDYVYLAKPHKYLSSRVINVSGTPIAFTAKTSECKHKHTYYHIDDIPELQNCLYHRDTSYEIFHTYIKPIYIHAKIHCQAQPDSESTLYIHIRSGDIFSKPKPHKLYVQPPLSYYDYIISLQKPAHIILVSEDRLNPCINALLAKYAGMITHVCKPGDPKNDIAVLCRAKSIVFGMGTFSFPIMCLSGNLAKVWFPKYDNDVQGPIGLHHLETTSIPLPGYMKPGEWANTPEQRKLMLEYSLPVPEIKDG